MGQVMYLVLIQLLLFAMGASLVAIYALIIRRPKRWSFYVLAKVGIMITNGILVVIVLPTPEHSIHITGYLLGYLVGLACVGVGVLGIAKDILSRAAEESVP